MLQISREHEQAEDSGGKDLHHVARYDEPRPGPGPDRSVVDVVTDDLTVYRFSQLSPGDPWTFEPGTNRSRRSGRHGRLPGVVEAIIEAEADSGWHY